MIDLTKSQLFSLDGTPIVQTQTLQQSPDETRAVANLAVYSLNSQVPVVVGSLIDNKYKVTGLLGEGGMGAVYKAHHMLLNKDVALKTFKTTMLTEDSLKRFEREAKAIAKLNPANVVHVFDFGVGENNVPYYTMEYLVGKSLAEKLEQEGPLSADAAVKIFLQVCRGLSEAHNKGIIHRDLKPANIFLTSEIGSDRSPRVKLVDFGVAGFISGSLDGQKLTATGSVFGSPLYMSPEQSMGKQLTPSTDIYSCGCALFEALTGSPPFRGENAFATMLQHQSQVPPSLTEKAPGKTFPEPLQGLVYAMLEKEPEDRPTSVDAIAAVMTDILEGRPIAAQLYKSGLADQRVGDKSTVKLEEIDSESQSDTLPPANAAKSSSIAVIVAFVVLFATTAGAAYWFSNQKNEPRNSPAASIGGATPAEQDYSYEGETNTRLGWIEARPTPRDRDDKPLEGALPGQQARRGSEKTLWVLTAKHAPFQNPELFDTDVRPDLWGLKLSDSFKWTDRHLAHVGKLKQLLWLHISECDITDESLKYINALPNLSQLDACGVHLSKSSIAQLNRLPNLTRLSLSNVPNLSGAFARMTGSKSVTYLELCNCNLSDSDVKVFATLPNLGTLQLNSNPLITNDGFSSLARLKNLRVLKVSGTAVNPEVIPKLKDFTNLEELIVDSRSWSEADLKQAKAVLPKHPKVDYTKEERERLEDPI